MYNFVSIFLEEITKNVFKLFKSSLPAFGASVIIIMSDGADWHHIAKSQTNGFIEKLYINMNLLFFNNKFFVLNKVFDILNF